MQLTCKDVQRAMQISESGKISPEDLSFLMKQFLPRWKMDMEYAWTNLDEEVGRFGDSEVIKEALRKLHLKEVKL